MVILHKRLEMITPDEVKLAFGMEDMLGSPTGEWET
jgi:hypothetical protein